MKIFSFFFFLFLSLSAFSRPLILPDLPCETTLKCEGTVNNAVWNSKGTAVNTSADRIEFDLSLAYCVGSGRVEGFPYPHESFNFGLIRSEDECSRNRRELVCNRVDSDGWHFQGTSFQLNRETGDLRSVFWNATVPVLMASFRGSCKR